MSEQPGLVVARYRRHVTVESSDGRRHDCQIKGRNLSPMIGDRVRWQHDRSGEGGIVTSIEPRTTTLSRVNKRGEAEIVAANLSQLIAVLAPKPEPDWLLLDRYLCAAELASLECLIVFNKIDLDAEEPAPLVDYERIGYRVCRTSAKQARNLDALEQAMHRHMSVMVGQSGVGKSSLINALLGKTVQATGDLTAKGAQGRHTTSTAVLHRLANGGGLVDSPGARDFAPHIADPTRLELGFREFRVFLGRCRFDDCRHRAEPDCAVKAAVMAGLICERRHASYAALYALVETLLASRAY